MQNHRIYRFVQAGFHLGLLVVFFTFFACSADAARVAEPAALSQAEAKMIFDRLKEAAGQTQSLSCTFVQEKYLSRFGRTIRSEGRLFFRHPDALRWEYTSPLPSGFAIHAGKGRSWSSAAGSVHRSQVRENHEFSALAEQIMLWLAFSHDALGKQYAIDVLSASPAALRLTPHSEALQRFLQSMTIVFMDDSTVKELRILETGGDSTTIYFSHQERNGFIDASLFAP